MPNAAGRDVSDLDLIARYLQSRSEQVFRQLYRRHTPRLYGLAVRLLGGRTDADDVVQDAWMRALSGLPTFRGESALGTWLCGIVVNCVRERLRARGADLSTDPDLFERLRPGTEAEPAASLDLEALIAALPPGYRAVLVLHDVEGYTHEEIAKLLDFEPGTSKSQLSRARSTLRRWLRGAEHDQVRRRG